MKKIVLTGGGTAGHVTPNLALLPYLKEAGYEIDYIGSYTGIEKGLIENEGITYHGISSGKLRRYIDLKNLSDPFRVIKGVFQSMGLMRKLKPNIVFSKGGFVSVPVVIAAKLKGVPVIIHESDITPGLANKIAMKFAKKVCCNFPETLSYLPANKAVMTGSPIRGGLLSGDAARGRELLGFTENKPILFIICGSLGSVIINDNIRKILPDLLQKFNVVHMCGKDNVKEELKGTPGYVQFEYIGKELADIFAVSDIVVSRAGANSICELLALRKPNLLIPLSAKVSRGDQILNANSFSKQGFSLVLDEEEMSPAVLNAKIDELYERKDELISAMQKADTVNSCLKVMELIEEVKK